MTPTELRALLFLAFVALVGAGARLASSPERAVAEPAERSALRAQLAAVDSARARDAAGAGRRRDRKAPASSSRTGARTPSRPAPPAFPIDVDRADSAALDALPGIGPALA